MKEREILWQAICKADILSASFSEQLGLQDIELPLPHQEYYFDLTVAVSDRNFAIEDRIHQYSFRKPPLRQLIEPKDIFGEILNDQIHIVCDILKEKGYEFGFVTIKAKPMEAIHDVSVTLAKGAVKEYDAKGKIKKHYTIVSIIPWEPGFQKIMADLFADFVKEKNEQAYEKSHSIEVSSVELIPIKQLYTEVVIGLRSSRHTREQFIAVYNKMLENSWIKQDTPLHIEGRYGRKEVTCDPSQIIPQRNWLLYIEQRNGIWSIEELPTGLDVQYKLARILRFKSTKAALSLYQGNYLPCTVRAKTTHGFIKIAPGDSRKYSSVEITWNKPIQ